MSPPPRQDSPLVSNAHRMLKDGTISKDEFEQLVECDVKCQLELKMEVRGRTLLHQCLI